MIDKIIAGIRSMSSIDGAGNIVYTLSHKEAKDQLLAEILKGAETYQDNHYDGSDTWEDYVEAIPVEYIEELFKETT